MVVIALMAMIIGFLAQHLGLTEAVSGIINKIARCYKCTVFWCVMITMLYFGYAIHFAVALSFLCAYMSNWLGMLFMWLNAKHNEIWERLNKQK